MSSLYNPIITTAEIKQNKNLRWKKFCLDYNCWGLPTVKLQSFTPIWKEVKFEKNNKHLIPRGQGVYAFVVRHAHDKIFNSNHRFILYVGQAIDLQDRFETYFKYRDTQNPSDQSKRIMTVVWEDYLFFNYFETNGFSQQDLDAIEYDLIDLIVPPINHRWRAKYVKQIIKLVDKT